MNIDRREFNGLCMAAGAILIPSVDNNDNNLDTINLRMVTINKKQRLIRMWFEYHSPFSYKTYIYQNWYELRQAIRDTYDACKEDVQHNDIETICFLGYDLSEKFDENNKIAAGIISYSLKDHKKAKIIKYPCIGGFIEKMVFLGKINENI